MTRVLFLYTKSEMERSEELKDLLQTRLGPAVNINNVIDVIAEDSTLKDELCQSGCVVLIYSQQCEKYLQEGKREFEDEYVTFDGSIVKTYLKQNDVIDRMLVVHFGWKPGKLVSERIPKRRVFELNEKIKKSDARVDQVVDAIKGIIRK